MPNAKMSCFVDTNLLVYTVDPSEAAKRPLMSDLLRRTIRSRMLVLSVQSLNECYRVITNRRRMMPDGDARRFIEALVPFCTAPLGFDVTRLAWRIQDASGYSWWDCLLLGSAAAADCKVFLSEDMQHERAIGDLTILNPFKLSPDHELIS
jgi:predicted nucleic acid-binding protein